ncbi:MAG: hypothetical protein OHK0046_25200 [Anaerolineae bacterium]
MHSPRAIPIRELVGNRYQILSTIGRGGMGMVHRAQDRITGQVVALKQVTVPSQQLVFSTMNSGATTDYRLALAQEFKVLATLRHPHIISVLDYGFDSKKQPYFTMELLENAQTITAAARERDYAGQVELVIQVLQALTYLHRRGILHRDLKPDNVLVVNGAVKVLDFGLAVAREYLKDDGSEVVGTMAYIPPEVLQGEPATYASDLYSVGLMVYELFNGAHPFRIENFVLLIEDVMKHTPDVELLSIDDGLAAILARLVSKDPTERYPEAGSVLNAYAELTNDPRRYETESIRESFLQAARFVGRENEVNALSNALMQTLQGSGSAWLIGGESGVGKTRLLEELRTLALVNGVQVLRGQAISEDGAVYLLWRDALRQLALQTQLSDLEASVLKAIIPDIARLLNRPVPDAPPLAAQAAQERLLQVIEDVFARQESATLLVLEDLHWITSDSLAILRRLTDVMQRRPLMILGSYRNDEHPNLDAQVPAMTVFTLARLSNTDIEELSASILGDEVGRRDVVVDLLQRETEGNVFFIVEVVRALAEEAGQLDQIGTITLPKNVFSGGMRLVINRRLERIPEADRALLRLAAIGGRRLDLPVLQALFVQTTPGKAFDAWLGACADAAVIDVQDDQWRFAHDKLRDEVLNQVEDDEKRILHAEFAHTIEQVYPDDPAQIVRLAYHWREAENLPKELHYTIAAGKQAIANSAYREAVRQLERAVQLSEQVNLTAAEKIDLHYQLGEAYFGIGAMDQGKVWFEQALHLIGLPMPSVSSIAPQLLRQMWHRVKMGRLGELTPPNLPPDQLLTAVLACEKLSQVSFINNDQIPSVFYALQGLNLAERGGEAALAEQVRFYGSMTLAMGITGVHPMARRYLKRADQNAERINNLDAIAWKAEATGAYFVGLAQWEEAERRLRECMQLGDDMGNARRWAEGAGFLAVMLLYQARWEEAEALNQEFVRVSRRIDNKQGFVWGAVGSALYHLRRGDLNAAAEFAAQSEQHLGQSYDTSAAIRVYSLLGQVYARMDNFEHTLHALELMEQVDPNGFHLMDAYAAVVETQLRLMVVGDHNASDAAVKRAFKQLNAFAKPFHPAKPLALLYQAWHEHLSGSSAQGPKLARKAIQTAQHYRMPYEEAIARLYLAQWLPNPTEQQQAEQMLERLGVIQNTII